MDKFKYQFMILPLRIQLKKVVLLFLYTSGIFNSNFCLNSDSLGNQNVCPPPLNKSCSLVYFSSTESNTCFSKASWNLLFQG